MICQSGRFKPFWNRPDREWATGLAEPQGRMCRPRPRPEAEVERVILVPLADRVRVPPREPFGVVAPGRAAAKVPNFIDLHVPKYPMVAIPAVARSE